MGAVLLSCCASKNKNISMKKLFKLVFISAISLIVISACDGSTTLPSQHSIQSRRPDFTKNNSNAGQPSNAVKFIDYSLLINHADADINRAYQESFKHLGALLLYYQQKLAEMDEGQAALHMSGLPFQPHDKFLGYKIDDLSIKSIDTQLKHESARKIWQAWCPHPDNFVCNFFKFVNHGLLVGKSPKNIEDIFVLKPYEGRTSLFTWFDDGLGCMQNLVFGKSYFITRDDIAHADPNKWCY